MAKANIIIIGAGVMGQGLAEAIAGAGHDVILIDRSEERRVGKECRSRWSPYH